MSTSHVAPRVNLATLRRIAIEGGRFAMLTAYDYPTAALAQTAGVHSLLIGDSMGTVLLGHPSTRDVPLELMLILGEAVRRGAPDVYLVGDLPYRALAAGPQAAVSAAQRFCDEAGCDAVKAEVGAADEPLVRALVQAGFETIAHLGLRPQQVDTPDGYRAQAREPQAVRELVADAQRMVSVGAAIILLEAVPAEASAAVVAAVDVPVIGCGAGPACHGHVLVTQDLVGLGLTRPPRFVPVMARTAATWEAALRQYVRAVLDRSYPGPEHVYAMRGAT